MNPVEAEALKIIRTDLITGEGRIFEHVATTFRWLMGSLLAVNGGAIVAMLGSDNPLINSNAAALRFFAVGLVFSVLIGSLSSIWGLRAAGRWANIRAKVDRSLLEGVVDKDIVPDMTKEKPNWKTWVPSYAGGVSFVCFIAGVLAVAARL